MHLFLRTTLPLVLYTIFFTFQSRAILYQEPLTIDELDDFFSDDGCIEGTLSATETGSPVIKSVSFVDSPSSSEMKPTEETSLTNEKKSPMSLISELAAFNQIKHMYKLIEEDGPSHKKRFVILLELGEEEYTAEGTSIKRAQHEAARLASLSTLYKHPPEKPKSDEAPRPRNDPVQMLYSWAGKHGDAAVEYTYIDKTEGDSSIHHRNYYHKDMYSKPRNVYQVIVKVLDQEFLGEGPSSDVAKHEAAKTALKQLQQTEGYCMFDDSTKSLIERIINSDSNEHSPVSLVFEFASKSKLPIEFMLFSEDGPAHMKRFVYKCKVGDNFETFGEATNKKAAKYNAAKKMVDKLKTHATYSENCSQTLKLKKNNKKKNPKNLVKLAKNTYKEDKSTELNIPENIDPISKLMQIQQAQNDIKPIFKLLEEKGEAKKEFFIEVSVGHVTFVGSGPNKKTAKRNAAAGVLEKLGYTTPSGDIRLHASQDKKQEFAEESSLNKKPIVPGININSDNFINLDNSKPKRFSQDHVESSNPSKIENTNDRPKSRHSSNENQESNSQKQESPKDAKNKLTDLSKKLSFRLQFSDFPKGNSSGFVSLLSMTTDPPKVCYGTGETTKISQDFAAANALKSLYKSQLDSISRLLNEQPIATSQPSPTHEWYIIDGKEIIKTLITKESE